MAEPRRALVPARRRGRTLLLIAIPLAALLIIGGVVLAQLQRTDGPAVTSVPGTSSETAAHGHSPSASVAAEPSKAAAPSRTPSPTATEKGTDAAAVLAACQARVDAGDKLMAAAAVGMRHWSDHVQAQTDANAGRISARRMDRIFTRTRRLGPDDERKYRDAVAAHEGQSAGCEPSDGAPPDVADRLERCVQREQAQQPVLQTAGAGMTDWIRHQDQMRASRAGHAAHPQRTWLRTWRAAPPKIEAYEQAVADFEAPDCRP
jgi:hypothetical protein